MATQRITVVTIGGEAGLTVTKLFRRWLTARTNGQGADIALEVDLFAHQLRTNGGYPPILYFTEWFDLWLMSDTICGTEVVEGKHFEAWCGSRIEAAESADRLGEQYPEQRWLAARLREAAEAWQPLAESAAVVLLREVLGPTITDEEVRFSLRKMPEWLSLPRTVD